MNGDQFSTDDAFASCFAQPDRRSPQLVLLVAPGTEPVKAAPPGPPTAGPDGPTLTEPDPSAEQSLVGREDPADSSARSNCGRLVRRLTFLPPRRHDTVRQPVRDSQATGPRSQPVGLAAVKVVERPGFLRRVARRIGRIRPPLTADQQLRLLQLALSVKLKREGKPADAIRLALLESDQAERERGQPTTPSELETKAR
jgi:hypothetical protein